MQMEFLQSEQNAPRRRWILVLVDSTDGVTGKTGQTGTVNISKNGGTPVASTNSIVEVDSVNMPGHYYIELTSAELDTLGMISIYYKAATTLAFHDRGYITYQDPFAASGVLVTGNGGSGSGKGSKVDYKKIREIMKEELAADEEEETPEEMQEEKDYTEKLDLIVALLTEPEEEEDPIDFSPVLQGISSIEKPRDYSAEFAGVQQSIANITPVVAHFGEAVRAFEGKMSIAEERINESLVTVKGITDGFAELQGMMAKFKDTFDEQTNMDKRFASINGKMKDDALAEISKKITDLAVQIVNLKYDLKLSK